MMLHILITHELSYCQYVSESVLAHYGISHNLLFARALPGYIARQEGFRMWLIESGRSHFHGSSLWKSRLLTFIMRSLILLWPRAASSATTDLRLGHSLVTSRITAVAFLDDMITYIVVDWHFFTDVSTSLSKWRHLPGGIHVSQQYRSGSHDRPPEIITHRHFSSRAGASSLLGVDESDIQINWFEDTSWYTTRMNLHTCFLFFQRPRCIISWEGKQKNYIHNSMPLVSFRAATWLFCILFFANIMHRKMFDFRAAF